MHPLSAVVTCVLVTAGAGVSLIESSTLDIPLHFGNQAPAAGGNETGNGTQGNGTEAGDPGSAGNGTEDGGNVTAEANGTHAHANATQNETKGNGTAECYDMEDCHVSISDSGDVWLSGGGDWSWRVTDEMRYVHVYLHVSSHGIGVADSVDATLRDGAGRVIGELRRTGSFGDYAVLEVDLDRSEDEFFSGEWSLELDMEALNGYYDVWIEASCEETYGGWW